ncbi:MAG: phosphoenolpyruvate carboxykinase [Rhodobiaceae bacterium]|jgi:phosphoenolpyruvate carboxykinase (ATP)|nr:phosphoenolpyruvate carboxykinase [Rhodobiaceae bacterium]MBT7279478.1 phosphoenolpyruvate carboxykinase [Rhodobiaceae bacterium]
MKQTGFHISKNGIDHQGLEKASAIYWNLRPSQIYEMALARGEGEIADSGPLLVKTGSHTGRSAQDKFIVRDATTEDSIWWDNNKSMTSEQFDALHADMLDYATDKEFLVQDLFGGADETHRLATRVVTELAWHSLFIQNLLIEPETQELDGFDPSFVIMNFPGFKADTARHGSRTETMIAVNFDKKLVLICGTSYAGETKKSVFSMLNYALPAKRVMPMHCSVNVGDAGDSAVFFGLSGTGKTTLSADPNRVLVGDDEHGWSENGVFNFEGGCYAKMINLSAEAEPEIFATTKRFGTVLENVVMDPVTRELDFNDNSLAENSRGAYPLSFIPNASETGTAGHPKNIIMLTADAFGVLPPISRMTPSQAMYHFLSGYTAKVAGTEKGVTEPEATFSTCFGAPFMPRHPSEYGNLLRDLIAEHDAKCWLVNTGWTGGAYGIGNRMPIKETRALLSAALDGSLNNVEFRVDENFGFDVPVSVPGVDDSILNPRDTWADKAGYDAQAHKLVSMFVHNFDKFMDHVDDNVRAAALAAE